MGALKGVNRRASPFFLLGEPLLRCSCLEGAVIADGPQPPIFATNELKHDEQQRLVSDFIVEKVCDGRDRPVFVPLLGGAFVGKPAIVHLR